MFNVNDILDKYINGDNMRDAYSSSTGQNVNNQRTNVNNVNNIGGVRGSEYLVNNENIQIRPTEVAQSNIKITPNMSKGATLEDDEIFDNEGNLNMICKPLIICSTGKCGVGKSYLIKQLIYNYSKVNYFKFGLAFVSTKFNGGYDYLPDQYVIENYNEQYLKNYIDKLKDYKKKKGNIPPSFICLDDVVGHVNFYSPFWSNLISTYRHLNLTIILGTQSVSVKGGVSTLFRQMVNVCFMFRTLYKDTIEAYYKAFGALCEDLDEFEKMFLQVTSERHACLMFVNDKHSKEDSYYSYKAPSDDVKFKLKY
jgi:hypothetical protein